LIPETFHARVQKQMRVQLPRLLRWKYKLSPGEVMKVRVTTPPIGSQKFYARLQKGGRITIPKITAELLDIQPGQLVEIVVWLSPDK